MSTGILHTFGALTVKLHTRLVLLLAVTFGIFLSIAASIIYSVIQPAFEKLEQAEAATNVKRVQKALANEIAALDQQLLDILACPVCKGPLLYEETRVICPACRKAYPIRDDVPVMLPNDAEPWAPTP